MAVQLSGQIDLTSAQEGTALADTTDVASFTDPNIDSTTDFTAEISWGDGSSSAGTVIENGSPTTGGVFTVEGGHTYVDEGNDPISVTFTHTADSATARANGSVAVADTDVFTPHPIFFFPNVNQPFSGLVEASFNDNDIANVASDFTVTLDWGDGQTTTGTVSGGNGNFAVTGAHTYTAGGEYGVKVTIADDAPGTATSTAGSMAIVRSLSGQMTLTSATENTPSFYPLLVATFTDTNVITDVPNDFTATIAWGDGTTSPGTIVGQPITNFGTLWVEGSHTYADEGNDLASVTLTYTPEDITATASGTVAVAEDDMLTPYPTEIFPNVNQAFSGPVTSFYDYSGYGYLGYINPASDFTASIDWGDGQTTTGTVSGPVNGFLTVSGSHTYAAGGYDYAKVTLADDAPGTATVTATTIALVRSVSGQMTLASAIEDSALPNSTPIATFSDTNYLDASQDFTATIEWGDNTTSPGTVVGSGGSFTVEGGHTYADEGSDFASVTLTHTADGVTATASGTVAVAESDIPFDFFRDGLSDLAFQNEGNNPHAPPGSLLIDKLGINSVVTAFTYPLPDTNWHVVTSRDLNGDGFADIIWQNAGGQPGVWLMNGPTPIAEVGLADPGPSWRLVASGDTNGDGKADFIWQDTGGTLGVWLMNGATPTAEAAVGNPGSNWHVVGSADYNDDGKDDILLQDENTGNLMVDLMNGTSVMSSVSIPVGDPSWHAVSTGEFNGQAEIAWQNNNGQAGIWLMNGTTPVAEAGLTNPGTGWQLVSIDHFTPNGQGDLFFQSSINGDIAQWNMNGTSVTAMVSLAPPGTGWQSVNGHPFATG